MKFYRRLEEKDLHVRHDLTVRVATSARLEGMSMTIQKWEAELRAGNVEHFVEAPSKLRRRAEQRHRLRTLWECEKLGRLAAAGLREFAREVNADPAELHKAWLGSATFGGKCQRILSLVKPHSQPADVPVEDATAELRRILS